MIEEVEMIIIVEEVIEVVTGGTTLSIINLTHIGIEMIVEQGIIEQLDEGVGHRVGPTGKTGQGTLMTMGDNEPCSHYMWYNTQ